MAPKFQLEAEILGHIVLKCPQKGVHGLLRDVAMLMAANDVHTTAIRQKKPRGSPFRITHTASLKWKF